LLQNKTLIFHLFIQKIRKNYNGAYGVEGFRLCQWLPTKVSL